MYNFDPKSPPLPQYLVRKRRYMEEMAFEAAAYVNSLTTEERSKIAECHRAFVDMDYDKCDTLAKECFSICDGSPVFFVMVVFNFFKGEGTPSLGFFRRAYFKTTSNNLESTVCHLVAWGFNVPFETQKTKIRNKVVRLQKVRTKPKRYSPGMYKGVREAEEMLGGNPATCEALYQSYKRILRGEDLWNGGMWQSNLIEAFAHKPYKFLATLLMKIPKKERSVATVVKFLYSNLSKGMLLNLKNLNDMSFLLEKPEPRKRVFLKSLKR